jgi:hypothetical protein
MRIVEKIRITLDKTVLINRSLYGRPFWLKILPAKNNWPHTGPPQKTQP